MRKPRKYTRHLVGLILALAGLLSVIILPARARRASAQAPGPSWSLTGSLFRARTGHTATLLANGMVLVVGGYNDAGPPLNSEELYDPATGTWRSAGHLNSIRFGHTATLLPNGKVLVAGGANRFFPPPVSVLNSAELYDPATGVWSSAGALNTGRSGHTATLLPNGKVLVTGGSNSPNSDVDLDSAELYDPATGRWSLTGNLTTARTGHAATLLPSGQVLVVGVRCCGSPARKSAELYDPITGTWSSTGQLNIGFGTATATLLPNGKVLFTDGFEDAPATAELYDPATGMWSVTGNLNAPRHCSTATLLPNGQVMAAQVLTPDTIVVFASTELYDPATGIWSSSANPNTGRCGHTATLLPNGNVLMTGGQNYDLPPFNSAELFDLGLPQAAGTVTSVSAASFSLLGLASEAITASFGVSLATATRSSPGLPPLPISLAGTTVRVKDSAGAERFAPLFFVSPTQVNYQIPPGTTAGVATVTITSGDGTVSSGVALIKAVAPSLFTANGNGQGVAAAVAVRVKADGSQQFEPIAQFDAAQNKFVALPLDLGPETDQVYLVLFGTGIRLRNSLSSVIATIGGAYAEVSFAGAQGAFVGSDQINVRVPRSLAGRGEIDVLLTVEAQMANAARVNIK